MPLTARKPFLQPLRHSPQRPQRRSWWRVLLGREKPQVIHWIVGLHIAGCDWRNRSALS